MTTAAAAHPAQEALAGMGITGADTLCVKLQEWGFGNTWETPLVTSRVETWARDTESPVALKMLDTVRMWNTLETDQEIRSLSDLEKLLEPSTTKFLTRDWHKLPSDERLQKSKLAKLESQKAGRLRVNSFCEAQGMAREDLTAALSAGTVRASDVLVWLNNTYLQTQATTQAETATDTERRAALIKLILDTLAGIDQAYKAAEGVADNLRTKRGPGVNPSEETSKWLHAHGKALRPPVMMAATNIPAWLLESYGVHMKVGMVNSYLL